MLVAGVLTGWAIDWSFGQRAACRGPSDLIWDCWLHLIACLLHFRSKSIWKRLTYYSIRHPVHSCRRKRDCFYASGLDGMVSGTNGLSFVSNCKGQSWFWNTKVFDYDCELATRYFHVLYRGCRSVWGRDILHFLVWKSHILCHWT